jgi:hypothetical protein
MPSVALVSYLQFLSLLGAALTDGKLLKAGLFRQYKVLFWFLIFFILSSISYLVFDVSSQIYQKVWISTEPALWAFEILVVRELYRLILSRYQGLLTLGRWAMSVSIAVAVVVSVASLLPRITPAMPQSSRIMGYVLAAERGVDLSLALYLLLTLVFLTLYPVPLPRNVLVHAVVYSVFFLSNTFGVLLRVILGLRLKDEVNLFLMGISSLCMFAWFLLLSARGEEMRVNLPWISSEHEQRLLEQLDALNATILRASRF